MDQSDSEKVILPELGMDMTTETSPEQIGLIWDECLGHSAAIVKEYCLSLSSFYPEIIPGGLTPVAQPLDKVINKVFKGHFRDLLLGDTIIGNWVRGRYRVCGGNQTQ